MNGTIGSAGNYPSDEGFVVSAGQALVITGATAISGVVELKLADGTFDTWPDSNGNSTVSDNTMIVFDVGGVVRLSVDSVSGPAKYEFR